MNWSPPADATLEIPGCTLVQPIGRGGNGEVWLARTADGAWRAVKIVRRDAFESRRQFEREFSGLRQYASIARGHHALIDVLDAGRDDDVGFFYCVMELADSENAEWGTENAEWGMRNADSSRNSITHSDVSTPHSAVLNPHSYVPRTLRSELARGGALPMSELLPVAMALTSGVGHLHRHGLLHRDIRLDNVLLVRGLPQLTEVGLVTGQASARSIAGIEGYLPPGGPGTPAADLFGLGKVLYELLTGGDRRDFPKIPADHATGPEHAARLEFNEIILRACAPRGEDRYQSADELLADLALLQSGGSVIHTRALRRRVETAKKAALSGAAIILVLCAAWAVTGSEARKARRAEQAATANFATARLAQARAERISQRIGHRVESLRAIAEAAAISPNSEMRTEAAGALALTDLRETGVWRTEPHADGAIAHCFDPDLKRLAVGYARGLVILFDADGREIARFTGSTSDTLSVVFSHDGKTLAARFQSGGVCAWSLETYSEILNVPLGLPRTGSGRPGLSGDGTRLAAINRDGLAEIFDLLTGTRIRTLTVAGVSQVLLSPEGKTAAVAAGTAVKLYSVDAGTESLRLEHPSAVECLAWHPQGKRLATACANSEVRRWDLPGRSHVTFRGHTGPVTGMAIDPVGGLLATHSGDGTSRMWDAESGALVLATEDGCLIGFSRDGSQVEMHVEGHGARIYSVERSTVYRTLASAPEFRRDVTNVDFTRDAKRMSVTTSSGLTILETSTGQTLLAASFSRLGSAWFIDDGRALLTTGYTGLQRFRFEEIESSLRLTAAGKWPGEDRRKPLAGAWATAGSAPRIGVVADDGALVVNLDDPLEPAFLPCGGNLHTVSVSPDSRYVAVTTRHLAKDGFVLDRETGSETALADTVDGIVLFSPCGRWLATTTGRGCTVRDAGSWRVRWRIARPQGAFIAGALAFSGDGNQLAIATSLTQATVVDSATGHERVSLPAPHPDRITSLAFTPDDRQLAVGTGTGIVQCWDLVRLREELGRFGLAW